jgi:hypothetical protein
LPIIDQRLDPLYHQQARTGSLNPLFEAKNPLLRKPETTLPSTAFQVSRNQLRVPSQGLGAILQGLHSGALDPSTMTADHQNRRPLPGGQIRDLKRSLDPQQGLGHPPPLEFDLGQFAQHQ